MTTTPYRRRVMKSYHSRRLANGGQSSLVDATPLQPILTELRTRMSWTAVAALVGTSSHGHVAAIANGQVQRINADLFRRILEASRRTPDTGGMRVNARSAERRVRALHALGYSVAMIAREIDGYSEGQLKALMRGEKTVIRADRDKLIRDAYERLSMRLPTPGDKYERGAVTRARTHARHNGWAAPLAWNDIDRDAAPTGMTGRFRGRPHDEIDNVIVEQLLAGVRVESTVAEKCEAMRRWLDAGRSEAELCRMHRWKDSRYTPAKAAA